MTSRHTSPTGAPFVRSSDLQFVLPESSTHVGTVFGGAGIIHIGLLALLFLVMWLRPPSGLTSVLPAIADSTKLEFVLTPAPGPSGGRSGGGGNESIEPPRISPEVAVRPPESFVPPETIEPERVEDPAIALAALIPNKAPLGILETGPASITESLGTGVNPGAGRGPGGGVGEGPGPGVGKDGPPGCCGEGPGGMGGATAPTLIERVRPAYTSEAMIRGVRGEVMLACVVLETGAVGKCDVVRSPDGNAYGLEDAALRAASKWRFRPGMSGGRPVPVRVNIVLEFNMR